MMIFIMSIELSSLLRRQRWYQALSKCCGCWARGWGPVRYLADPLVDTIWRGRHWMWVRRTGLRKLLAILGTGRQYASLRVSGPPLPMLRCVGKRRLVSWHGEHPVQARERPPLFPMCVGLLAPHVPSHRCGCERTARIASRVGRVGYMVFKYIKRRLSGERCVLPCLSVSSRARLLGGDGEGFPCSAPPREWCCPARVDAVAAHLESRRPPLVVTLWCRHPYSPRCFSLPEARWCAAL
ncbi:T. brucei spp.-specific protein [Trypanosoma brucei gambiense DAL972]|uniref:T. brucei spp.-specific protein n=1 Tax=Trypanosoma brucei gambiense (strain MHOM/CI/86/DAL972) TaxID=679716 RepID=D0A5Y8_TRYB9|nr:T. brucei spp.-specific protein [Trypanosoma brucei gambiense DAL972]CBH17089.1 T. brucei spp.-specific protein [Trypanosoma brucei gambiense DAL972]|eukprot:XP_011779353.1 T. brucei spp.-specific protein [Trypanosoma brucei gambiense DAL972]